jgi:DNA mismatch endonuclease (patch repair protein)
VTDVLTREQRWLNMSRIRGKDTKPELQLRRGLHAAGLRYRLHPPELPGRPDIVFPRHRAVVLVHGCFWHGHDCHLFRMPATRSEFWNTKITRNQERDQRTVRALMHAGWRVLTVWECAVKGPGRHATPDILARCLKFVTGTARRGTVTGRRRRVENVAT